MFDVVSGETTVTQYLLRSKPWASAYPAHPVPMMATLSLWS